MATVGQMVACEFWTYNEVSAKTGLSVEALRARAYRGDLPIVRIGRRVLIRDIDLAQLFGDARRGEWRR